MQLYAPQAAIRPEPIIGCGGQGGAGKTFVLVSAQVLWSVIHHDVHKVSNVPPTCIIADTIPNLKDRIIRQALQSFPGLFTVRDDHKEYGRCLIYNGRPNLGAIALRYGEELDQMRGKEFGMIGVEEASTFAEHEKGENFLDMLEYPLRTPIKEVRTQPMMFAFNWDGIGVSWLEKLFWQTKPDSDGRIYRRDASRVKFIDFSLDSHPDQAFAARQRAKMEAYTGAMRESRLLGKPTRPTGAMFAHFGDQNIFRFRERFPAGLPPHYKLVIGYDWGIADPCAIYWTAIDENGDRWTYREVYEKGLLDEEQARIIIDNTPPNEKINAVYIDPSMNHQYHRRQTYARPVADTVREILSANRIGPVMDGPKNTRVSTFRTLGSLLHYSKHSVVPNWYIEEGCVNLINELKNARYQMTAGLWVGDLDPRCSDHALTAAGYHLLPTMGWVSPDPSKPLINIDDYQRKRAAEIGQSLL